MILAALILLTLATGILIGLWMGGVFADAPRGVETEEGFLALE